MSDDLLFQPALRLGEQIRRRELSPVELVEASLKRIEQLDPQLNSFVTVDADAALRQARAAEETAGDDGTGPFHGVPIGIKDLHLTEGLRTTLGTASMAEFVPPFDEENIARLRRGGFIVIGKTNVPELGTVPYTESKLLGPCRNPWNTEHTPGGSSGGAAAAVAAGLIPAGHGSDGGGSIRIPASNCALVGVKPSRGRVSQAPLFGDQGGGLTSTGSITRYVEDAAAMLDLMAGYVAGDPYWAPEPARPYLDDAREDPQRLRIGLVTEAPLAPYGTEAVRVAEEAAALLEDLGHEVEPLSIDLPPQIVDNFRIVWSALTAAMPIDPATLEPYNQALHRWGTEIGAGQFLQARSSLQLTSRLIVGASWAYDVVLSPTMTRAPLRIGEFRSLSPEDEFAANVAYVSSTPIANVTGQPSMSLPLGFVDGLPMGVLVTGRPADESTLFRLAGQLQRATDWTTKRPPVS